MKNKIEADSWFISCSNYHDGTTGFYVKIEYHLADEINTKSHKFPTYEEAYQWVKNQVVM